MGKQIFSWNKPITKHPFICNSSLVIDHRRRWQIFPCNVRQQVLFCFYGNIECLTCDPTDQAQPVVPHPLAHRATDMWPQTGTRTPHSIRWAISVHYEISDGVPDICSYHPGGGGCPLLSWVLCSVWTSPKHNNCISILLQMTYRGTLNPSNASGSNLKTMTTNRMTHISHN